MEALTKVAAHDPPHVLEVLDRQRPIEAELGVELRHLRGGRALPEDGGRGVTGDEPDEEEHDDRHPEERRHEKEKTAREVPTHAPPPPLSTGSRYFASLTAVNASPPVGCGTKPDTFFDAAVGGFAWNIGMRATSVWTIFDTCL